MNSFERSPIYHPAKKENCYKKERQVEKNSSVSLLHNKPYDSLSTMSGGALLSSMKNFFHNEYYANLPEIIHYKKNLPQTIERLLVVSPEPPSVERVGEIKK